MTIYADRLKYRPEIDGLRFLAILPVVLFHSGLPGFSGGFVGVDVFFVISGFLITRVIAHSIYEKSFSGWDFYERRIRRLLPPLVPVLLVSAILGMLTFSSADYQEFVESVWATIGLHANWYFLGEVGYFDGPAHTKPLLHMWSLSIEEQFYLFTPFVLMTLISRKPNFVVGVFALIMAMSFGYAVYLTAQGGIDEAFFNSFARIWELLIGVCLALLIHFKVIPNHITGTKGVFARVFGLALILGCVVFYTSETVFPGLTAAPAVLGTAILIAAGRGNDFVSKFLCLKPVLFVGAVSYGFYLWHWPAIVFADLWFPHLGLVGSLSAVVIAFLLSVISYYIIETPIRKRKVLGGMKAAYISLIVSAIFISGFAAVGMVDGPVKEARLERLYGQNVQAVEKIAQDKVEYMEVVNRNFRGTAADFNVSDYDGFTCSFDKRNSHDRIMDCLTGQMSDDTYLIFGDSIGRDALYAFRHAFPDTTFLMVHQSGCAPAEYGKCFPGLGSLLDRIKQDVNPKHVILASRFKEGQYEPGLASLYQFSSRFETVSLLGVVPHHNGILADDIGKLDKGETLPETYVNAKGAFGHLNTWEVRQRLYTALAKQSMALIDVTEFFCGEDTCRLWLGKPGRDSLFWDRSHMTLPGIEAMGEYISDNNLLDAKPVQVTQPTLNAQPSVIEADDPHTVNLEILNTLHDIILAENIPASPKMQDINKSLPGLLGKHGLLNIAPETGLGWIGYRSDGENYKLVMYDTGDCGEALLSNPDMVDRKVNRYKSGPDCRAYGFWSQGPAERF